MSSPMVEGIYYSKMPHTTFMWALVNEHGSYPAHFGDATGPYYVVVRARSKRKWFLREPEESYMIMPKGVYKW